jgi:class 3 adenylate cyclase/uncharacterized protein (DUF427 family)
MNIQTLPPTRYAIDIQPLEHKVQIWRGELLLSETTRAKVMYETRLDPVVYVPVDDLRMPLSAPNALQTFCPFKGTASYRDLQLDDQTIQNAVWSYDDPLPESAAIKGYVAFSDAVGARLELGENRLREQTDGNVTGPLVDWLLREAGYCTTPEAFTLALGAKLNEQGVTVSRIAVMIWSLHPLIAAKNYRWRRKDDVVDVFAPEWAVGEDEEFLSSPFYFVSEGLGGVRQKLDDTHFRETFPIMAELKDQGATDYVAFPMAFADGRRNVLTLTCDGPDGFTTEQLGLIFECLLVIGRFYEVFMQRENAQSLLETYVGKRTGARVLGGEIRRGDGDEIDAAIMFCDLRGSTRLEAELGRDAYIELLNGFFDSVDDHVRAHDGEVLKFIGDAVLAVFPADGDAQNAKRQALSAAQEIVAHLADSRANGLPLDCATGLSYGRVTYGNIGSQSRLDFTVIGAAANLAARLADHAKLVGEPIVASADVICGSQKSRHLGDIQLHNIPTPVTCHAIAA